jgi:hypothetical protein
MRRVFVDRHEKGVSVARECLSRPSMEVSELPQIRHSRSAADSSSAKRDLAGPMILALPRAAARRGAALLRMILDGDVGFSGGPDPFT